MTLRPLETITESLSSTQTTPNLEEYEPEAFTIIKISGKGMGMVANTDIPPGRLILEEKPLLSVPLTAAGDLPGRYDATSGEFVSTVLIQSLSKLTDTELEEFYLLSDSVKDHQRSKNFVNKYMPHMAQVYAKQSSPSSKTNLAKPNPNAESPRFQTLVQKLFSRNRHRSSSPSQSQTKSKNQTQQKVLSTPCEKPHCDNKAQNVQQSQQNPVLRQKTNYGIMKTNSFTIEITVSKIVISPAQKRKIIKVTENRLALFPKISRLNHSCQPNCNHYWCGQAGKFMIRAIRPISKGEELSISYMSPLRRRGFTTRECRRKILFQEFGFLCQCEICNVDPEQQDISDGKKEDIKIGATVENGSTTETKPISYSWKQSVPLNSPSSIKSFFPSTKHLNNLLSGTSKSQMFSERDEQNLVVPKGVIVTRIEF